MKYAPSLALVFMFVVAPVTAQVSGSINRDAPVVTSSITFKDQSKLDVSYTAIHFGEGSWQSIVENEDRHERFNGFAARKPIGSVSTTKLVMAAGREIPAGDYDMYFTVSKRAGGFILNLKDKGSDADPIRWRMVLVDTDVDIKRMKIRLDPADAANAAQLTIAFGKKSVSVPVTEKSADADKSDADKAGGEKSADR